MNFKEGVILSIDKPYAMSSFGALAHIRYLLTKKMRYKVKVGHAGTLDPLATGVLILCTGKKTKEIETLQAHTKEYVATLQLGASTASHDMEHPVDEVFPTEQITRERIEQVLTSFVGDVKQVPPVFDEEMMQISIRVVCGKGTYIRSLARDIGEALDSAAYLTSLCRTRVGDISLQQCITLEQFPKWLEQQDLELLEQ